MESSRDVKLWSAVKGFNRRLEGLSISRFSLFNPPHSTIAGSSSLSNDCTRRSSSSNFDFFALMMIARSGISGFCRLLKLRIYLQLRRRDVRLSTGESSLMNNSKRSNFPERSRTCRASATSSSRELSSELRWCLTRRQSLSSVWIFLESRNILVVKYWKRCLIWSLIKLSLDWYDQIVPDWLSSN